MQKRVTSKADKDKRLEIIKKMRDEGYLLREIAIALGLKGKLGASTLSRFISKYDKKGIVKKRVK